MSDEMHRKYVSNLRGNQDIFLIDIMRSSEFQAIRKRHLEHVFTDLDGLIGKIMDEDSESGRKILACADEVRVAFNISKENAITLLIGPEAPALYGMKYVPQIRRDGSDIVIRIGQKTTQADIKAAWKRVKTLQQEIGGSGSRSSINPELAFCIHRQYVLKGRKMKDIFDDYRSQKLEGYIYPPTIEYEDDFRKRYTKVVKGL